MTANVKNEFHLSPFAEFYELISDSFIDVRGAAASLKGFIPRGSALFELGLGTGYFASMFTGDGYTVKGIQPDDEMLPLLRRKHPEIRVVAEGKLEDYQFAERHETIVSHSSVFLFTEHETDFGRHGETLISYVFQSFITGREKVFECLAKTLKALAAGGRLFINIQQNPLPYASVDCGDGQLIFEMLRCKYLLESGRVEKDYRLAYRGRTYEINDSRFCATYRDFANYVAQCGYKSSISEDRRWIIVERAV